MYGSGFSSRWADSHTVQLIKQMLLSQDECPSRTEERKVILEMTIMCQTWVFHRQVLVLNQGHVHETVPFGPEKCWISQKIVLFFNQN